MKKILIATLAAAICFATTAVAQSAKEKAETLASGFNKEKHKEKIKNGVKTETHTVTIAKPDIKDDLAGYTGKYELQGMNQYLSFQLTADNMLEGAFCSIKEEKEIKDAVLKDIKVEAALLTATLQYNDGKTVPFEGVFINRTTNGVKSTGFGLQQPVSLANGFSVDKAFFKKSE